MPCKTVFIEYLPVTVKNPAKIKNDNIRAAKTTKIIGFHEFLYPSPLFDSKLIVVSPISKLLTILAKNPFEFF